MKAFKTVLSLFVFSAETSNTSLFPEVVIYSLSQVDVGVR